MGVNGTSGAQEEPFGTLMFESVGNISGEFLTELLGLGKSIKSGGNRDNDFCQQVMNFQENANKVHQQICSVTAIIIPLLRHG